MEPKIRLKGFSGEWEEIIIGDISNSFSGGTPSAGVASYYGGNIPFIRSGEIEAEKTQLFITEEGLNSSSARMVEKGTLLYALYGATSGEVGISKIDGAINQAILAIYPKKGYSSHYLSHYLRAKKGTIVGSLLQGGQGNLSGTLVKGVNVFSPKTLDEQQAIAYYLDSINSLIQSTTKKIESLKQVKAASLQSMFPQEGETTPRVRFKGFEGEWERVKFGDLGTVAMCKRIFKDQTSEKGDVPFFKIGTFGALPDAFISNELYQEYKSKFSFPNKGDILISAAGTIGRCIQYNGEDAYFQDSNIVWLKHNNTIDNSFLRYIYSIVKWKGLEGATIQRLYNSIILEAEFLMPTRKEQTAIASFFSSLDSQIVLQTKRLEKLKQIKSACLDNMFV